MAESAVEATARGDAMSQTRQTFTIEAPAARVAAALTLLEIGNLGRHTFAASAEEAEALHEVSEQMRMQLVSQGAREVGATFVSASG